MYPRHSNSNNDYENRNFYSAIDQSPRDIRIYLYSIYADSPARSKMFNFAGHTAKDGCPWCWATGKWDAAEHFIKWAGVIHI